LTFPVKAHKIIAWGFQTQFESLRHWFREASLLPNHYASTVSMNETAMRRRVLALRMGSFRQGSTARHVAISAFALYALLLEAFLAVSAPAAAFAYQGEIGGVTCTLDGSGSGIPGGNPVQHHGLCCILACAAASCAYVGTSSAIAAFLLERVASPIRFVLVQGLPARPPLKHYFAARGPPANI